MNPLPPPNAARGSYRFDFERMIAVSSLHSGETKIVLTISYFNRTLDHRQCCLFGNTASERDLGLFRDADFTGHLPF